MGASWGGGHAEQVVMDAQFGWGMARARAVLTGQVWGAVGSWVQLSADSMLGTLEKGARQWEWIEGTGLGAAWLRHSEGVLWGSGSHGRLGAEGRPDGFLCFGKSTLARVEWLCRVQVKEGGGLN